MLYWLATQFGDQFSGLNLFRYLSFRAIAAALTAFAVSLLLGPRFIRGLQRRQYGQVVRLDGPQSHLSKKGTPTMGGGLILLAITVATVLFADLGNRYVLVALAVLLSFGAVGWLDDYRKLVLKDSRGLPARWKFSLQWVFGIGAALVLYYTADAPSNTQFFVPFVKDLALPLGLSFIGLAAFWIVGFSNAVNLTDGLDGLAILPSALVAGALGIFAYLSGHAVFADYLLIPRVPGAGELSIFCAGIAGAGLGFLWFNSYPAQVFMGDVGALALGAALGAVAVMTRQELVLIVMGGVFVLETISVMLQVGSYKTTGRRIFRMAPIHHHFELKGWPEPRVIVRFWILSVILVLVGLATLKVR